MAYIPRGTCSFYGAMEPLQDREPLWYVTKNGVRVSQGMTETDARQEAQQLKLMCEAKGDASAQIAVARQING